MTDKDLLAQLRTYGEHHRSEQPPVRIDEIGQLAGNGNPAQSALDAEPAVRAVPLDQDFTPAGSRLATFQSPSQHWKLTP